MRTLSYYLLLLSIGLTFFGCRKDTATNSSIPPANALFSCYVDGQLWVAETTVSIEGPGAMQTQYDPQNGGVSVTARRETKSPDLFQTISFYVPDVYGTGEFELYTANGEVGAFKDYYSTECGTYRHDPENPGTLKVTKFDTIKKLLTCEVSFVAKNPNCPGVYKPSPTESLLPVIRPPFLK